MKKLIVVLIVLSLCSCSSYKNDMIEYAKPICAEYITYVKADKSLNDEQKEVRILNARVVINEQVTN